MNRKRLERRSPAEPPIVLRFPTTRKVLYGLLIGAGIFSGLVSVQGRGGTQSVSVGLTVLDTVLGCGGAAFVFLFLTTEIVYWAGRVEERRVFSWMNRAVVIDSRLSVVFQVAQTDNRWFTERILLRHPNGTIVVYDFMEGYEAFCSHLHECS